MQNEKLSLVLTAFGALGLPIAALATISNHSARIGRMTPGKRWAKIWSAGQGVATMAGMDTKPKRRWLRFSLRTMFVVVTILGLWLFPQLKWIRDRHAALGWVSTQATYWQDMPVQQGSFPGGQAPWQIRMLGEPGMEMIVAIVEKDEVTRKQRELQSLFPEAHVGVHTPGPGYKGVHAK